MTCILLYLGKGIHHELLSEPSTMMNGAKHARNWVILINFKGVTGFLCSITMMIGVMVPEAVCFFSCLVIWLMEYMFWLILWIIFILCLIIHECSLVLLLLPSRLLSGHPLYIRLEYLIPRGHILRPSYISSWHENWITHGVTVWTQDIDDRIMAITLP